MKIFLGILDGLTHVSMRRKVHDGVTAAKNRCEFCRIRDVGDYEFESVRQLAATSRKIVINDDVMSLAPKNVRSVTADVSGSSNDKNGQRSLPCGTPGS